MSGAILQERSGEHALSPALANVPSTGNLFDGPLIEVDPSCAVCG